MGNKMLIDATHPEETRVVVLRGNRVEEFDFESASKKQLRGNIYLAKVTRVEPSLQAAFVNYGGNRHGFLAFSEIHPDYYQLPMAERQALKKQEQADSTSEPDDPDDAADDNAGSNGYHDDERLSSVPDYDAGASDDTDSENEDDRQRHAAALEAALPPTRYAEAPKADEDDPAEIAAERMDVGPAETEPSDKDPVEPTDVAAVQSSSLPETPPAEPFEADDDENGDADETPELEQVELVGSEDALEELPQRHKRRRRNYKIQEVIKRGQILLVQVVKEERGNKGAALTTYLSLAGRYTVLMPNTGSGGGISRKIASPADRKRLREIASELDVPEGMGLIIRTAGAARTKTEIKRDYEYLLRLWENVRDLTLNSTAPCLVYEEGDLIKRSIRDLYSREIDEVQVAGDDAYRDAKDFMRMLMPSHAKNVKPYKDPEPVFTRYEVERQLNAMFSPQVTLPSGGYIIINQTEALVAIDVNSGKSTREFSIEDTALKTNLEAAEEIARQLRLRDLAGLIVADFIDMEERRNNRAVERKLKECLRSDRARIQVGRISHFGLLEMSRQRIRTGMIEGSTTQCAHCQGTGFVRSTESVALSVLRSLEDWLRTNTPCDLNAVASPEVALYILNQKRSYLHDIEGRHGVNVSVTASERMQGANFYIEKVAAAAPGAGPASAAVSQSDRIIVPFEADQDEASDDQGQRSRRRRRRRRGRGGDDQEAQDSAPQTSRKDRAASSGKTEEKVEAADASEEVEGEGQAEDESSKPRRRSRRRGRRGGRQQKGARDRNEAAATSTPEADAAEGADQGIEDVDGKAVPAETTMAGPEEKAAGHAADEKAEPARDTDRELTDAEASDRPDRRTFRSSDEPSTDKGANGSGAAHHEESQPSFAAKRSRESVGADHGAEAALAEAEPEEKAPPKPKGSKRGWWQRREA